MLHTTDYVVFSLLFFYAWQGWRRGFLRSILTPVIFVVSVLLGTLYFRRTNNLFIGFLIGFLGPIVLNVIASLVLGLWRKANQEEESFSLVDRLLGSAVELVWGGALLVAIGIGFFLAPLDSLKLGFVKDDVVHSLSFHYLSVAIKNKMPQIKPPEKSVAVSPKPADTQALQNTEEYQKLMSDPRIKELLSDEETLRQIKEKDLAKLLNNPRIATILQDTQLLKEFLQLNQKMMAQTNGPQTLPASSPKKESYE